MDTSANALFHDSGVGPVLESSCVPYILRFPAIAPCIALDSGFLLRSTSSIHGLVPPAPMLSYARDFLALMKKSLFSGMPLS